MEKKKKSYLFDGPIPPEKVAKAVENHQSKTHCGAHSIFLGQIRKDEKEGASTEAIEYSAYEEMANKVIAEIREEAFEKWDLACLHVYHSIGRVNLGEVSLMVMVSSAHRRPVFGALEYLVDEIKDRVPIWKKEIYSDGSHKWIGEAPKKEEA